MASIALVALSQAVCAAAGLLGSGELRFEENLGQTDPSVLFLTRAQGHQVFVTNRDIVFAPADGGAPIRMTFEKTGKAQWKAAGSATDSISYYLGNDSSKWVKGARLFDRIIWRDAYPGIDVVLYGKGNHVEYDLVLAPGADPSLVRVRFAGGTNIRSNSSGEIEVESNGRVLRQKAPEIYQESHAGSRRKVEGNFILASEGVFHLELGDYERSQPLIVDPVIESASYVGGENDDEIVFATDLYIGGNTRSLAFPGTEAAARRSRDVFVRTTEPSTNLSGQVTTPWIVVLGGSDDDELAAGTLTGLDDTITLAGTTRSLDFPGAGLNGYRGGASDGFIASFLISRSSAFLTSARYIGGSGEDRLHALDVSGDIQVTVGVTDSPDLSTVSGRTLRGKRDGFVALTSGSIGVWHYEYIGGSEDDIANAVRFYLVPGTPVAIWIGGETRSPDFPFKDASLQGPSDGFLTEIRMLQRGSLAEVTTESYRAGGSGEDSIRAFAMAPSSSKISANRILQRPVNGIGIAGVTSSPDLPVISASKFGGQTDGIAGLWDPVSHSMQWLAYIGGSEADEATSVSRNWAGGIYVAGWTQSADLPVRSAAQSNYAGGTDGMLAMFEPSGAMAYLTYYGGSGDDRIHAVTIKDLNIARIAGTTASADLPERNPIQDRGQRTEGFFADIGTDHLIGPSEVILAKDGVTSFSLRTARTSFRVPVTYRSSDPGRVRFVSFDRSMDEFTGAADDNVIIEALAGSGEVEITATAEGFDSKTITVRLYPGAFILNFPTTPVSTWSEPLPFSSFYSAIDTATGKPVGPALGLRHDLDPPIFQWSTSDAGVIALHNDGSQMRLRALRPGQARLELAVEGFSVVNTPNQDVTVQAPEFVTDDNFHLGEDMEARLPLRFHLNGQNLVLPKSGMLTARSEDPSRLLLASRSGTSGSPAVSISAAQWGSGLWAQALAGEGQVRILFTSTEFEGEVPMTVTLEPVGLHWGVARGTAIETTASVPVGSSLDLVAVWQGESGTIGTTRRLGAPPVTLLLSNSDSRIVELNRLTSSLDLNGEHYRVKGLSAGSAELALAVTPGNVRIRNPKVRIGVQPATRLPIEVPKEMRVGNGLQAAIEFRYSGLGPVTVVCDDPSSVLVSLSASEAGASEVILLPDGGGYYKVFVQAMKGKGEARIRLRAAGIPEQQVTILLTPSALSFSPIDTIGLQPGFEQRVRVSAWAVLEPEGVAFRSQIPRPGVSIEVRLRTEGAAVTLSRSSLVLTTQAPAAELQFTRPIVGLDATLIADTVDGTGATARLLLRSPRETPAPVGTGLILARDALQQYSIPTWLPASELSVTSSDPARILLSTGKTENGSASVLLAGTDRSLFVHALGESGNAAIRFESGNRILLEVPIALTQRVISIYGPFVPVEAGRTLSTSIDTNAPVLRPGATPAQLTIRPANPLLLSVEPETLQIPGPVSTIKYIGLAAGTTKLQVDGPPEIRISANEVKVIDPVPPGPSVYVLGKNLLAGMEMDLGAQFPNPDGILATIVSSDPGRLLLSRSPSGDGAASISVAIPGGRTLSQTFYIRSLDSNGTVKLRATFGSTDIEFATITLARSWVSCSTAGLPGSLNAGTTTSVSCGIRYMGSEASAPFKSIQLPSELNDPPFRVISSTPEVFSLLPERPVLSEATTGQIVLKAIAPGQGEVRVEQPEGFGPVQDDSAALPVRVTLPEMPGSCGSRVVLGENTQQTCEFSLRQDIAITATSFQPSLLQVSSDPAAMGSASATASRRMTLQALSSHGTAEVLFQAPGYQDLRVPVILRSSEFVVARDYSNLDRLELRAGEAIRLNVRVDALEKSLLTPRAGFSFTADITAAPSGVVTIEPPHIKLEGDLQTASFEVRGTTPGTTTIRLTGPAGIPPAGIAIPIRVTQ